MVWSPPLQGAAIGDIFLSSSTINHDRRIPIPGFDKYGLGLLQSSLSPLLQSSLGFKLGVVSSGNSLDYTDKCLAIMGSHNVGGGDGQLAQANPCIQYDKESASSLSMDRTTFLLPVTICYHHVLSRLPSRNMWCPLNHLYPWVVHPPPSGCRQGNGGCGHRLGLQPLCQAVDLRQGHHRHCRRWQVRARGSMKHVTEESYSCRSLPPHSRANSEEINALGHHANGTFYAS